MKTKLLLLFTATISLQSEPINVIWMKADKFSVAPGDKVVVQVTTGRDFDGTPVDVKKDQFVKAEHHTVNSAVSVLPQLTNGLKDHLTETLTTEGTHAIILRTNPVVTEIDAETFNAYLKEYSVDEVVDLRTKKNATDKSAKVSASWYSSLILQAGAKRDDTYKKDGSYPLEIVPLSNPYDLKKGDVLRVKILWNDKPLFGARVKVWVRTNNTTITQPIYTQPDGVIEAPVSGKGIWTITVVKLIPSRNPDADWQGYQTSLTFGL
jgi:uncharacterized GH25 family protein